MAVAEQHGDANANAESEAGRHTRAIRMKLAGVQFQAVPRVLGIPQCSASKRLVHFVCDLCQVYEDELQPLSIIDGGCPIYNFQIICYLEYGAI